MNKPDSKKAIDYAIFLAGKKGIVIPNNSFGNVEWVKAGREDRAKSVTFKIPHIVKIDIPN